MLYDSIIAQQNQRMKLSIQGLYEVARVSVTREKVCSLLVFVERGG